MERLAERDRRPAAAVLAPARVNRGDRRPPPKYERRSVGREVGLEVELGGWEAGGPWREWRGAKTGRGEFGRGRKEEASVEALEKLE